MRPRKFFCSIFIFLCAGTLAHAQFQLSSNDPASLKWYSLDNGWFNVIYPTGCDSIARVYMYELEKYRPLQEASLGLSVGKYDNIPWKQPLPVILHTMNASSNGVVTWAPRRMELYTIPEWSAPSAMPWTTMLAIHEGRHAAQMQMAYRKVFRPFEWIFGEMWAGAMVGLYPGKLFLEGDAVVAETALSNSGRGRSAHFLNYYMYAFDNGDWRNWTKWRIGSYYRPAPDHYAFGYMVLSGVRSRFGAADFMERYFDYVARRPYDPYPFRYNLKKVSGMKFKESYPAILHEHYDRWAADTLRRGPFMTASQISPKTRRMTSYCNPNEHYDNGYLWVKEDLYHASAIVHLDTAGRERRLTGTASQIGKMNYESSDSSLLWNEIRKDPRWGQKRKSVIRSYHIPSGRKRTLTHYGEYFYPVEVSGDTIAAIHYKENGSEDICYLDKRDGREVGRITVPAGFQALEIKYMDSTLYAIAVTYEGMGLWQYNDGAWTKDLEPIPVQIGALDAVDHRTISFESDWNGSWELYFYDIFTRELTQVTSSKYGAHDYSVCENGDVAWSETCREGTRIMLTKKDDLIHKKVTWKDYAHYAVADTLSAQEQRLIRAKGLNLRPDSTTVTKSNGFVSPKRYVKGGHFLHLHSWVPFYADLDAIMNLSYDYIKNAAHLGTTLFFQNAMSTFSGWAGYKAEALGDGKWQHSGHFSFTYNGLYPVFELSLDINDRNSWAYDYHLDQETQTRYFAITDTGNPLISTKLRTYVPLSWNSGCHVFGLIPDASLAYRSDSWFGDPALFFDIGIRGYVLRNVPSSCVYPRFGIGLEMRYARPFGYGYLYGYLPGFCCGQGLKLSLLAQTKLSEGSMLYNKYANIMPRGMAGSYYLLEGQYLCQYLEGMKFTSDYAIPFYMGDWNIGTAFLCSRGIFTLHYDHSLFSDGVFGQSGILFDGVKAVKGDLFSVGATLEFEFGAFFWVRSPVTVGVTYSYSDGSVFSQMCTSAKTPSSHHYVGATFSIELPN